MKKALALSIVLFVFFALWSVPASADGPVTLIYAEAGASETTMAGKMAIAFKEKAESLSNGQIKVEIKADGTLGNEEQIVDNWISGGKIVDISCISPEIVVKYGCDLASVFYLPYTFVDDAHFWAFAASELAEEFLNEPADILGFRGLCYGEEAFHRLFLADKIGSLSELKGVRIGNTGLPGMDTLLDAVGAVSVPFYYKDFPEIIRQGLVQGVGVSEQLFVELIETKQISGPQKALSYGLLDLPLHDIREIAISDASWYELSSEQQAWVKEAAEYASQVCKEQISSLDAAALKQFSANGIVGISDNDKASWLNKNVEYLQSQSADLADWYQQINSLS